jgi:hypothetical protein
MKLEGWEKSLNDTIVSYYGREFSWADSSCVHFAADCVLAMTGVDYIKDFRGEWSDEQEAVNFIANNGGTLRAFMDGWEMVDRTRAQRGDVAIMIKDKKEFMGIVGMDPRFVLVRSEKGMGKFKIKDLLDVNFWRP